MTVAEHSSEPPAFEVVSVIVYDPAPLVVTFADIVPSEGSVSELLMKAFEPPLFTRLNE